MSERRSVDMRLVCRACGGTVTVERGKQLYQCPYCGALDYEDDPALDPARAWDGNDPEG